MLFVDTYEIKYDMMLIRYVVLISLLLVFINGLLSCGVFAMNSCVLQIQIDLI